MAIILAIALAMSTTAKTDLHTWQVEYDGNYYTYVADRYDNPASYIITLDGETVYITDIVGGENR